MINIWLFVSTPLSNMKVSWNYSSQYMENRKKSKPSSSMIMLWSLKLWEATRPAHASGGILFVALLQTERWGMGLRVSHCFPSHPAVRKNWDHQDWDFKYWNKNNTLRNARPSLCGFRFLRGGNRAFLPHLFSLSHFQDFLRLAVPNWERERYP